MPTEVLNDDPMDLEGDYVDVEDEVDQHPSTPLPPKRNTKGEALRLYNAWKDLIPSLIRPFLTYTNKSGSHPTAITIQVDHSPCASCTIETHKTTQILCLFWDRAYSIISTISLTDGL